MAGFAVLAGISVIGIVAALTWVTLVSLGIRRDDRGAAFSTRAIGMRGAGHGRAERIARHTTGMHRV